MFRDAVKYPTKADDEVRTYGIAVLLSYGSLLVVPAFFLLGYFVKVIRESTEGSEQIPKFEDFKTLFIDGVKFTGIMFAYFIVPVFVISLIESSGLQSTANLAAAPLLLLAFYLIPAAVVNFAKEDSLISAFNLREVSAKSFRFKYLKGYLLLALVFLLITSAQVLITLVLIITIIGIPALIVAWPVMRFYENLVYFRIVAKMAE